MSAVGRCILMVVLVACTSALSGYNYTAQLLSLLTPDHWCWDPGVDALQKQLQLSAEDGKKFSVPPVMTAGSAIPTRYSQCQLFDDDLFGAYVLWMSARKPQYRNTGEVKSCDHGWAYNYSRVFPTISSQMNWVCTCRWKPYVVHTSFWVGAAIGVILWEWIALRLGRHTTLMAAICMHVLSAMCNLLSTAFITVLALRAIVGSSQLAIRQQALFIALGPGGRSSHPAAYVVTLIVSYTIGSLSVAGIALLVPSWWWLMVTAVLPAFLCLPVASWAFLRRPYTTSMGNATSSIQILEEPGKATVVDDRWNVHNKTVLHVVWAAGCISYYGHCQLLSATTDSPIADITPVSFCWLASLVEIPCWGIPFLLTSPRRNHWVIAISLAGCALLGFTLAVTPAATPSAALLTISLVARLTSTSAYGALIHRRTHSQRDFTAGEAIGGAAVALVPTIVALTEISPMLPSLSLAIIAACGALGTLWLGHLEEQGAMCPHTRIISCWKTHTSPVLTNNGNDVDESTLPYKPLEMT